MIDHSLYTQIHKSMPIPCGDLVSRKNGQILLIKRKQHPAKDQFWFPGGRIFRNESFEEAAIRLAKNEVGLTINNLKEIGTGNLKFSSDPFNHGCGTHAVTFVYSCTTTDTPLLDDNHQDYMWWDGTGDNYHQYLTQFAQKV